MKYDIQGVRQEGDVFWALITSEDARIEIPFNHPPNEAEVKTSLAKHLGERKKAQFYDMGEDFVYSGGSVVRRDVFNKKSPIVSESVAHRPPYFGSVRSKYTWEAPSSELLNSWNVSDHSALTNWYSIKEIDGVDTFIKIPRHFAEWPNKPDVPGKVGAYASLFDKNGVESDERDVFFLCPSELMQDWCAYQGLTYPIPPEEAKEPWCFGIIWQASTGDVVGVKGYVRHYESGDPLWTS